MTKLAISFGTMVLLLAVLGVMSHTVATQTSRALEETYRRDMVALDLARRASAERLTIARNYRSAMLEKTEEGRLRWVKEVEGNEATFRADLDELAKYTTRPDQLARLTDAKRLMAEYGPAIRDAVRVMSTDLTKAEAMLSAASSVGIRLAAVLDEYVKVKKELVAETFEQTQRETATGRTVGITVTALAMIFAASLVFIVGGAIATPMKQAVAVLERVAHGDLTAKLDVDRKDEVGAMAAALNRSLGSIRSTLAGVQGVSLEVSAAASQLAASAQQISGGAQEQAASLEETAASLEEISSTVKQNTDNAQEASMLANSARDAAERGGQVVSSAVDAMSEITKSSKKIADIITTIDEIAFQTNLLALNAAVEAARAGEQGRGFGVVAAEVRSLAQRTGSAAKEIRGLIADSTSKVETGTRQVDESGRTLEEIVRSVKRVTDMVAEIAAASREQNTGIDQVNTAVTQVDQVTQSNAAQTEELSATATSLSDKSGHLRSLVAAFELGEGGARDVVPAARSAPRALVAPRVRTKPARGTVVPLAKSAPAASLKKVVNGYEEF
ncbi:methyl-accepting chemotaxis protein [Labilithrix luteola]|nr:methyl-accepting chemotaxis protein [Labilithrix luteola]